MVFKIGVVGCGTVGRGLVSLLGDKRGYLKEKYGFSFKLSFVSDFIKGTVAGDDLDPFDVIKSLEKGDLTSLPGATKEMRPLQELLSSTPVDIVCDATPTNYETGEPGMSILKSALKSGTNAITSSKGGVGLDLAGLKKLASDNGVALRYESSVLSGTPLINLVRGPLAGCEVLKVEGIVNGTTNYILTMMDSGAGYADALKEAQRLGYAEADPTGDVEGFDAAVKVCIMAQEFFGHHLRVSDVDRTGITGITLSDIASARDGGKRLKLIAGVDKSGGGVRGFVKPCAVDLAHPLASIMGATNAVCVSTDNLGDITIVGPGAGARETAQGLLSDMLDIASASK
ncbi:MAG: homoserine dehydrogenase [Synergistaceae bacterium]|jgi:homoserine dehydrogenase|nr:homoserine dehydrogenase [Synergistaceae bacterium]